MTQNATSRIATTMRAVVPRAPGGPDVLDVVMRDTPQPRRGEVLIATAFAGINRHDVGQRIRGAPPAGATDILGLEVSGVIVATGKDVSPSRIGEDVCALVNGGGYAQYCIADAALALPIPRQLSLRDSAALPEALFTGWFNVVELGRLARGAWLLVHGGTSGVGSLTVQVARHLGARVLATAGSDEKCAACIGFGAERAINYRTEDFVAVVQDATEGHGADVILDMVGGLYSERNLAALAKDGRVLHLFSGNVPTWSAPLRLIMEKRAIISGSLMRPLEPARKQGVAAALIEHVWPVLGTAIKPVIDSVYALDDVADAHRRLESSGHIGKLLLNLTPKP